MGENKHEINSQQDSSSDNMMNEIVMYQPDSTLTLDVRLENETVWLTQQQIADLFGTRRQAITKHLLNIFRSEELDENSVCSILEHTAADGKSYKTKFYNLDAILSVGYRVNSRNATLFRQWANKVLKEHLLRGYSVNQRLLYMENRIDHRLSEHEKRLDYLTDKVDFFVRTSLPPKKGVFFDGQIFDAHRFVVDLIGSAKKRVLLIDNYVDTSVLTQLDNRKPGVAAIIYTRHISRAFALDVERHNDQYTPIDVRTASNIHDRFLVIDDSLYHIGASIKDLGNKLFAFSKLDIPPSLILNNI